MVVPKKLGTSSLEILELELAKIPKLCLRQFKLDTMYNKTTLNVQI
jgi:hypothetical protein